MQGLNSNEIKEVVAYDLGTFLQGVMKGIEEGYKLDFEDVKNYPVQIGTGLFHCYMPKAVKELEEVLDEAINKAEELNEVIDNNSKLIEEISKPFLKTKKEKPAKPNGIMIKE